MTPTPTPTSELITPEGRPRVGMWLIVMMAVFGGAHPDVLGSQQDCFSALGLALGNVCVSWRVGSLQLPCTGSSRRGKLDRDFSGRVWRIDVDVCGER